jgi:hypothetical protein
MRPSESARAAPACAERDPRIEQASRPLEVSHNQVDGLRQGGAAPSPEAAAVADDLTFEAIAQACKRVVDYAEQAHRAAKARDAPGAAMRLRQLIITLRAVCEVLALLMGGAP